MGNATRKSSLAVDQRIQGQKRGLGANQVSRRSAMTGTWRPFGWMCAVTAAAAAHRPWKSANSCVLSSSANRTNEVRKAVKNGGVACGPGLQANSYWSN